MVKTGRRRHLRKSRYARFRTSPGGVARGQNLGFWASEGTRLAGSATGDTFTANAGNEQITATAHGWATGDGPFLASNSGGALPGGLTDTTLYWVNRVDANTVTLHTGGREEVSGTPVNITSAGTGTHTLTRATSSEAMFHVNRANKPARIVAASDIDDLD